MSAPVVRPLFSTLFSLTALVALATPVSVRAEQFVAADINYRHERTLRDSHHYEKLDGKFRNWVSPINYAKGKAVVRLEVKTKPNETTPAKYQVCFAVSPSYACTDQAPTFTKPGVYTWETPVERFFQSNQVNWSQVQETISFIGKDTQNRKPSQDNFGDQSANYFPMDLRVTVTLVSPGATYVDPTTPSQPPPTEPQNPTPTEPTSPTPTEPTPETPGTELPSAPSEPGTSAPSDDGNGTPVAASPEAPLTGTPHPDDVAGGCNAGAWSLSWAAALLALVWLSARRPVAVKVRNRPTRRR